jgi:SHS2 domain-containing protein
MNFLENFLYLLDAEGFLFSSIKEIKIDKKNLKLQAVVVGDLAKNYKISNDVKAITYNSMFVKKEKAFVD